MTETVVFTRTRRQTFLTVFSALMLTGASYLNFLEWQIAGRALPFLVCCGFGLWAALMWSDLLRRRTYGYLAHEGICLRGPFRDVHLRWDQLVWAKCSADAKMVMFAYRQAENAKPRHTGFAAKAIGQDGVDAVRRAIMFHRPDLPDHPSET